MDVIVYGSEQDYQELMAKIRQDPWAAHLRYSHTKDYDDMRKQLAQKPCCLVIVAVDGAAGMEACIGTRRILPKVPLFWFSNDGNFAPQSYRLDCTYFCTKPVSPARLEKAFSRLRETGGCQ